MNNAFKLLLAAAPVMLVAACGGGDDSIDDRLDIADPKVRLVHAIPAGPNVSLYRNAELQSDVNDVGYKFASKYFDVSTSPADWIIKTKVGDVEVGRASFNPDRGNKYTLVALPGEASSTGVLLIADPYDKELTANNGRVRVVNASFNASSVDVYLTGTNVDIATVGPTFANVGYKAAVPASGSNSTDFTAGNYQLRVTKAGTKDVILNAPLTIQQNADVLLLTLPQTVLVNDVKVLQVVADNGQPSTEIVNQP